jgi:hypothetical protein
MNGNQKAVNPVRDSSTEQKTLRNAWKLGHPSRFQRVYGQEIEQKEK